MYPAGRVRASDRAVARGCGGNRGDAADMGRHRPSPSITMRPRTCCRPASSPGRWWAATAGARILRAVSCAPGTGARAEVSARLRLALVPGTWLHLPAARSPAPHRYHRRARVCAGATHRRWPGGPARHGDMARVAWQPAFSRRLFSEILTSLLWLAGWWALLEWRSTSRAGWLLALAAASGWAPLPARSPHWSSPFRSAPSCCAT